MTPTSDPTAARSLPTWVFVVMGASLVILLIDDVVLAVEAGAVDWAVTGSHLSLGCLFAHLFLRVSRPRLAAALVVPAVLLMLPLAAERLLDG